MPDTSNPEAESRCPLIGNPVAGSRNFQLSPRPDETIYPVILAVPNQQKQLSGRNRTANLSRLARMALKLSSLKSNAGINEASKDEKGVPVPCNGYYWSLSHKPDFAAAVVSREPVGIDLEKIRPCSASLFRKAAGDDEWALADMDRQLLFFRYWTSKEAVLKAAGTGLRDLAQCRVIKIVDQNHLVIGYQNAEWLIEHVRFKDHMASVVRNSCRIEWIFA